MIKHYCDRCQKPIEGDNIIGTETRVRYHSRITDTLKIEFCEECFAEYVGKVNMERLIRLKTERDKRLKEREEQKQKQKQKEKEAAANADLSNADLIFPCDLFEDE